MGKGWYMVHLPSDSVIDLIHFCKYWYILVQFPFSLHFTYLMSVKKTFYKIKKRDTVFLFVWTYYPSIAITKNVEKKKVAKMSSLPSVFSTEKMNIHGVNIIL